MPRPVIGICAAVEQAKFGPWDEFAVLIQRSYVDSVQAAGGLALLLPPDAVLAESPHELLERVDGVVLGGGVDIGLNPARDAFESSLARDALERRIPLLGVCRGMQVVNVTRGGTLLEHLPDEVGGEHHLPERGVFAEHEVRLAPGSLAARAAGTEELTVKTHHHQGVDRLGEGLEATGWSTADELVEAIELPGDGFTLGVLWHPEEDPDDEVIPAFVAAAGA